MYYDSRLDKNNLLGWDIMSKIAKQKTSFTKVNLDEICAGEIVFFEPPRGKSGDFGSVRREREGLRLLSDADHKTPAEPKLFVDPVELEGAEITLSRATAFGRVYRALSHLVK
jgi:hypothetical protein